MGKNCTAAVIYMYLKIQMLNCCVIITSRKRILDGLCNIYVSVPQDLRGFFLNFFSDEVKR